MENFKKILINMIVITAAFFLFILWYENRFQKSIPTSVTPNNYKIYLITMEQTSQYWQIINQGVSDMAKLLKVSYIWDAPVNRDIDEQIQKIENAINNNADAIIIAAIDPVKVSDAIKNAKEHGIKIIYVDSPANEEGIITLATENYSAGMKAGNEMISQLDSLGIKNGSIGIIGVAPETTTTMNREKGFRDVIESDGRFRILDTQYAGSDIALAQTLAQRMITENNDLAGLFGTNEETTTGVGSAIKMSQSKVTGIGFDITDIIQGFLDDGTLQAVMVQNPYTMGYLGMAETIAALRGIDTGPPFINTGVSVRTKYTR